MRCLGMFRRPSAVVDDDVTLPKSHRPPRGPPANAGRTPPVDANPAHPSGRRSMTRRPTPAAGGSVGPKPSLVGLASSTPIMPPQRQPHIGRPFCVRGSRRVLFVNAKSSAYRMRNAKSITYHPARARSPRLHLFMLFATMFRSIWAGIMTFLTRTPTKSCCPTETQQV